ncbi:MAG: nucleotidyltransferase domain-containing protein [Saprospiraceae bacterium]|nr:nucleotidyltransferase domain-containing protein [Saprospiraceae bacterium]
MDKKQDAVRIARKFADIIKERFQIEFVYLYGSYVNGNYREESDIDIAVILKDKDYDFLAFSKELFRLRREIDLRIEPVLLEMEDNTGFLAEIIRTGIQIV